LQNYRKMPKSRLKLTVRRYFTLDVQCHRTDLIIIKEYLKTEILDKTYPSVGKLLQNFKKIAKSQLKLIVMVLML